MTKKELRKIYLKKRMELSDARYHQLNEELCENFFVHVNFSTIQVLHLFLPIEKNREVNTWLILDRVQEEYPRVRIAVPKINNQSAELEHYYFENRDQLENNTWGIPEPIKGIPAAIEKIDAVLVPLLAFDRQGHRLGYGRGFYDRFLANCRPDCRKIGLSFFEEEEEIGGIGEKDIPLNMIITPDTCVVI